MAYIRKIVGHDEELIGIARLHWIYVVKGIAWFVVLSGAGWLLNNIIQRVAVAMAQATDSAALPVMFMTLSNGAMYFLMFGGALIFFFFTLKVLVTEIGLSTRRVMHKEGLIFIKVQQIDIEEIRGENLDLGYLGRILGYGYLLLDCRFIGDVRLPAIEKPERFLKALHERRAKAQDSLSVVLGKGNAAPLNIDLPADMRQQQQPEIPQPSPPQPTPEIQPGGPAQQPEVTPPQPGPEYPGQPVPHGPPPTQPAPTPQQPQPEVTPPPAQPTPAPGPDPQPPLQPGQTQANTVAATALPPTAAEDIPMSAPVQQQQYATAPSPGASSPPIVVQNAIDPNTVKQVVQQIMPQMAQQVAKELVDKGIVEKPAPEGDKDVDTDLIHSFDDAALDKDGHPRANNNRLEHIVH
jgi:hypothetical protein